MTTTPRSAHLTYEDYLLFPEDGKRHELIQGEHVMTPAPSTKHQRIVGNLHAALHAYLRHHPLGQVFFAPCDVVLSDEDVVQPDILFVSAARASIVTPDNIQGAPDLIVEILSAATRKKDAGMKRKLYERYGVQEYWLVDPELETVTVLRLEGDRYVRAHELAKETGDALTSPLLPSFSCPLAELFE